MPSPPKKTSIDGQIQSNQEDPKKEKRLKATFTKVKIITNILLLSRRHSWCFEHLSSPTMSLNLKR